jgi:aryl-alcohol dehydrogenase-like predicted oxidoreductase
MRLSYAGRPPEADAVRVIRQVIETGVTLLDTADVYCETAETTGHNERLIRDAIAGRDDILVATKGGHVRRPDGSIGRSGSAEAIRASCEASLRALGVERIDLYYHHSPDPLIPFLESLGAIADLQREGKVAAVGVSNYRVAELEQARAVVDVAAVQNRLSHADRESLEVVRYCERAGIAFLPWGVLGRSSTAIDPTSPLAGLARVRGVSPQRVAVAWALSQSPCVIPVIGARSFANVADCLAAAGLVLTEADLDVIDGSLDSTAPAL